MSSYSVGFDIFARDRASDVFDKVGGRAEGAGSKMGAFKDKAKVAGALAGAAVVAFGKTSVEAFVDAEKSQRVLEDAYARFPALADVSIQSLRDQAAALQNKTKFDGDNINAMQGSLAAYKLSGKQIQDLTPLILDYAEKTGKDLPTAANDIGKAMLGQGKALKEVGIKFKDTGSTAGNFAELMGGLRTQVGGFAEKEGASAEGKAEILKNKFGDLQETVGSKLLPVAEKLTDWLTKAVDFIGQNSTAIGTVVIVGGTLLGLYKAWTIAQTLLNVVMTANPIGLIVIAVAALAAGIIYVATQTTFFQDAWKVMTHGIASAWRWVWNSIIAPIIRFILNGFANMTDGIAGFLRALSNIPGFGWAKTAADKMDGAARKAREMARGIKDIPSDTQINLTLVVKGRIDAAARTAMGLMAAPMSKQRAIMSGRASGGPVKAGQPYLVGEEGPEIIMPNRDGMVMTASETAAMLANRGRSSGGGAAGGDGVTVLQPLSFEMEGETLVKVLLKIKRNQGGVELGIA